ncbi:pancreatic lipase-related protein 2-like [Saccoglossus kowalevskii]|uniref:Pancreatic lipase-related protein 2-like n=1 Tax=Saccoglossus kowalevskii TaxID=10224 RepID=A0ABM0GW40_SACKO|nr:PREDICTED: pancreatic lipase-related protein 2-like [Saccoglossus kowalevskii]
MLNLIAFLVTIACVLSGTQGFEVEFRLYTDSSRDSYTVVDRNDPDSLHDSTFNSRDDSKFIIHGYLENAGKPWIIDMKDRLLDYDDYNVFAVDWKGGANDVYSKSAKNTDEVGYEIAEFIQFLVDETRHSSNQIHLIGFSLGAHASGHAGRRIPDIARISGLDPAGPAFEGESTSIRLDPSDAKFVDVIHTDGDPLIVGGFGAWSECGHVDYYPNGGKNQPGCSGEESVQYSDDYVHPYGGEICDHGRAHELYAASIHDCEFKAYPCEPGEECDECGGLNGCNEMGFHTSKSPEGSFYVKTTGTAPYC